MGCEGEDWEVEGFEVKAFGEKVVANSEEVSCCEGKCCKGKEYKGRSSEVVGCGEEEVMDSKMIYFLNYKKQENDKYLYTFISDLT